MITQGWWDGAIENYSLIIMDLPFKLKKKKKKNFWQWMVVMVAQ